MGLKLTTLYTLDRVLYSTHITGSMLEVREMDGRTQPYMKGSWGSTSWFFVDERSRDNTTGSLRHCDSIKSPKTQEGRQEVRQAGTLYALTCIERILCAEVFPLVKVKLLISLFGSKVDVHRMKLRHCFCVATTNSTYLITKWLIIISLYMVTRAYEPGGS